MPWEKTRDVSIHALQPTAEKPGTEISAQVENFSRETPKSFPRLDALYTYVLALDSLRRDSKSALAALSRTCLTFTNTNWRLQGQGRSIVDDARPYRIARISRLVGTRGDSEVLSKLKSYVGYVRPHDCGGCRFPANSAILRGEISFVRFARSNSVDRPTRKTIPSARFPRWIRGFSAQLLPRTTRPATHSGNFARAERTRSQRSFTATWRRRNCLKWRLKYLGVANARVTLFTQGRSQARLRRMSMKESAHVSQAAISWRLD